MPGPEASAWRSGSSENVSENPFRSWNPFFFLPEQVLVFPDPRTRIMENAYLMVRARSDGGAKGPRIDKRQFTDYSCTMIKTFRHKGLEKFFLTGSRAGINPLHAGKLRIVLTALNMADSPGQMNAPGWKLHKLTGDLEGFWAVWIDGSWRLIFRFEGEDAFDVNYLDYH